MNPIALLFARPRPVSVTGDAVPKIAVPSGADSAAAPQAFPTGAPAVVQRLTSPAAVIATFGDSNWVVSGTDSAMMAKRAAKLLLRENPDIETIGWRPIEQDARKALHLFSLEPYAYGGAVTNLRRSPDLVAVANFYEGHAAYPKKRPNGDQSMSTSYIAVPLLHGAVSREDGSWRNPRPESYVHSRQIPWGSGD